MSQPRSTAGAIFHFIYNVVYLLLCLLLAALILITPGDAIRQAYLETYQFSNIVIIAIVYLVTTLIVLFVYSLRLYVTRTVLAGIPKNWIPIGKGDVSKDIREMIQRDLGRSAAIAWAARPKVVSRPTDDPVGVDFGVEDRTSIGDQGQAKEDEKGQRTKLPGWERLRRVATVESDLGLTLPPVQAVWGEIEHPGWGSPDSPDLSNVQYGAVLAELPNLIEGRAISLLPTGMAASNDTAILDPESIILLQREPNMSMRAYVGGLVDLGVLNSSKNTADFLDMYERARFSTRPMSVSLFRRLMHLFAELLRSTQPFDRSILDNVRDTGSLYSDSDGNQDIDDDAPQYTGPTTPAKSLRSMSSNLSSAAGTAPSPRYSQRPGLQARHSSGRSWGMYGTAPTTPNSKAGRSATGNSQVQRPRDVSKSGSERSGLSVDSFAQTRQPYVGSSLGSEQSSLRSGSQGSVIRLATSADFGDLPYVLRQAETL